ncbi:MAG: hypothetical protein ACPGYV_06210 [Phycisphaeraceae bacterium]
MKMLSLLLATAVIGLLWLPLHLWDRPGGVDWASDPSRLVDIQADVYHAGLSPQAADRRSRGDDKAAEPVVLNDEDAAHAAFATIDLTIDPLGQPLGAYQIELTSLDADFAVVGVEAGEHDAFDHGRPPYFDPVALVDGTDRLVIAEYARTDIEADALPTTPVRIATVHVELPIVASDAAKPLLRLTLLAAGDAEGKRIDAKATYAFRTLQP